MKQPMARYIVECYDYKINEAVENYVSVSVFADDETSAISKAQQRVHRKEYKIKEVTEFFYDDRLDCVCGECKE